MADNTPNDVSARLFELERALAQLDASRDALIAETVALRARLAEARVEGPPPPSTASATSAPPVAPRARIAS